MMAGGQHLTAASVRGRVHPPGQLSATLRIVINISITTAVVVVVIVTPLSSSLQSSDLKG